MKLITICLALWVFTFSVEAQNANCCVKIMEHCYAIDSVIKIDKAELLKWSGVILNCQGSALTANNYDWVISLKAENTIYKGVVPAKDATPVRTFNELLQKMESGDLLFIEGLKLGKGYPAKFTIQVQ